MNICLDMCIQFIVFNKIYCNYSFFYEIRQKKLLNQLGQYFAAEGC